MKTTGCLLLGVLFLLMSCGKDDNGRSDCSAAAGKHYLIYDYFNEGAPTITADPVEVTNEVFYGSASAKEVGNEVVITIPGLRVRTETTNYEVVRFQIDEKIAGDNCFVTQSEFDADSSSFKTDIASVLVLDMSTSVSGIINNLKTYAKEYANTVVNSSDNSKVAVVFFSSRDAIESTRFYSSANINQLHALIDEFTNYQERTALYQATMVGIELLNNEPFDGEKSLVVFTDGGDNDSNNPTQLVQQINASTTNRFAIGLRGSDFRENNLSSIVSSKGNMVVAETSADLQKVFRIAGRGVISVYELQYRRSDQLLNADEAIQIRVSMETRAIQ